LEIDYNAVKRIGFALGCAKLQPSFEACLPEKMTVLAATVWLLCRIFVK